MINLKDALLWLAVLGLAAQQHLHSESAERRRLGPADGDGEERMDIVQRLVKAQLEPMTRRLEEHDNQLANVAARLGALEHTERRRAQRDAVDGSGVVRILTRQTRTVQCPPSDGRPDAARCTEPEYAACHREVCAASNGHRRAQAATTSCLAQTLAEWSSDIHLACCSQPGDDCTGGTPASCDAQCAEEFLPFWTTCGDALGKDGQTQFASVVALCEAAATTAPQLPSSGGSSANLAVQLGVQCTDGSDADQCVPDCSEELRGYLMLLNIDGDDSKLSCELHHGVHSWLGPASEGGYLGKDVHAFVSAIISAAAGVYVGQLLADAHIDISLVIEPGQRVRIVSDIATSVAWGSGGITVSPGAALLLSRITVDGGLHIAAGATVTLEAVTFGSYGCLTTLGNGQVILTGGTIAPGACDECSTIEHCATSQCTEAGVAVCASCDDGFYSMRRDEEPGRCITATVSLQIAAGLDEDAQGLFAFNFREALPSDLGSGTIVVPQRAALSFTGSGAEPVGTAFIVDGNSLTLSALSVEGELAVSGGGSVTLLDCILPVDVLSATLRPVANHDEPRSLSHMRGSGSTLRLTDVSIPERTEWGAITGSITIGAVTFDPITIELNGIATTYGDTAQSGPVSYDPPFLGRLAGEATFVVSSGPCTTRESGRCVGRPDGYGRGERCEIAVLGTGVLAPARTFDTETFGQGYDALISGPPRACNQCQSWGNCGSALPCPRQQGQVVWAQPEDDDGSACNSGCWRAHLAPPEGMEFSDKDALSWRSDGDGQGHSGDTWVCDNVAQCEQFCAAGLCGQPESDEWSDHPAPGGGWEICFL